MATVDVQQIDRRIGKLCYGFVEGRTKQRRERGETALMVSLQVVEYRFVVGACMGVATPCVDGIAAGVQLRFFNCGAECGVRDAAVGAQFHDRLRPQRCNEPMREGDVSAPGAQRIDTISTPEKRVQGGVT
nr:hypothetical protein [Caballeronia sp. AZ1_KS37]